jgi:N4-gp56 family major capsid protein
MAGEFSPTNSVIASELTQFIPELWSDEVIVAYKSNLVMANLVRKLNHRGKKGDTIKIPTPTRGSASTKSEETQVTLQQHGTDNGTSVSIDKHKEYSRLIEDFADVQALASLRRFYTDDAGYAIAKRVDTDLIFAAAGGLGGTTVVEDAATGNVDVTNTTTTFKARIGDDSAAWDDTASASEGNATDITDAGLRSFVKRLDDQDAPHAGRYFVIPTVVKQDMTGFARFTEQAFTGEVGSSNTIRNGLVGDIYGVEVYVSTNLPTVEDTAATNDQKLALMFQRDALVLVEQLGIRTQESYMQQYLASLFTADMIYGTKLLRTNSSVPIVVPSTAT